jgi:hypothetical protein
MLAQIKQNIVKGWITSLVGITLMVASLTLWITGVIPIKWDATIGIALGTILLLAPNKIEKLAGSAIKGWGGNNNDAEEGSNIKPDNPDK